MRKQMVELRQSIDQEEKIGRSIDIAQNLRRHQVYQRSQVISCYMATGQELGTLPFIQQAWADGKLVYIPKIMKRAMSWAPLTIDTLPLLEANRFGILELPESLIGDEPVFDLIVVPGLTFTKEGDRLGYGGGYYDRFFPTQPEAYRVGVCFRELEVDELPVEAHDYRMDEVLFI